VDVLGVELLAQVVHRLVHVLRQRVPLAATDEVALAPDPLHVLPRRQRRRRRRRSSSSWWRRRHCHRTSNARSIRPAAGGRSNWPDQEADEEDELADGEEAATRVPACVVGKRRRRSREVGEQLLSGFGRPRGCRGCSILFRICHPCRCKVGYHLSAAESGTTCHGSVWRACGFHTEWQFQKFAHRNRLTTQLPCSNNAPARPPKFCTQEMC
jgi:hypothetical protein